MAKWSEDRKVCCLLCKHFLPEVPDDWKPDYAGQTYDSGHVAAKIKADGLHQHGMCALYPVHIKIQTAHGCGQFKRRYRAWKDYTLYEFIWGKRGNKTYDENRELRRQLKVTRARSHKRLERIKELTKKPNGKMVSGWMRMRWAWAMCKGCKDRQQRIARAWYELTHQQQTTEHTASQAQQQTTTIRSEVAISEATTDVRLNSPVDGGTKDHDW
jgi:hypothetical protein